ncbi:MAG TPA: hypothetical protein V6C85_21920, partial [Allocoleopsis sp.]
MHSGRTLSIPISTDPGLGSLPDELLSSDCDRTHFIPFLVPTTNRILTLFLLFALLRKVNHTHHFGELPLKRIAVLRALGGLGDLLCAVPALRSLRAAHPQAEIVLIGLGAIEPLVRRFDRYLDTLLEFPGYPGLPEQPLQV